MSQQVNPFYYLDDDTQDDIWRLFKAKKTLAELLRDRGYNLSDEEFLLDPNTQVTDFYLHYYSLGRKTFRENLAHAYSKKTTDTSIITPRNQGTLYVAFYLTTGVLSSAELRTFEETMVAFGYKRAIVVSTKLPLASSMKEVAETFPVEFREERELYCNPTKHFMTPKHEYDERNDRMVKVVERVEKNGVKVDEEKLKPELLRDLMITSKKLLPVLSIADPVSRYYDFKSGDVIRITREKLSGPSMIDEYITYRVVENIGKRKKVAKKAT